MPGWLKELLIHKQTNKYLIYEQCPAGRVFQYRVGSGQVLDKIPGSGSGSGRVGVSKYTIGYFWVFRVCPGMLGIFGYFRNGWMG